MPLNVLPSRTTQVLCASRSLSTHKCSCRRGAAAAVGRASPKKFCRSKGCECTRSPQRSGPVVQATERFTEVGATIDQGLIARAALDLEEKGWAVVPDVVSSGECEQYVNSAWAWLENLDTGIQRNDPTTWGDDRWPPSFRGIINTLEISHQDFVWRVRQHPRILQVFEALWGTNELLSSFDSINILKPGQHESSTDGWLHVDQAPLRKGVTCIQGLLNMVDVGPETGTLLVKDGSHSFHEDFFQNATVLSQEQKQQTKDFYKFQDGEREYFHKFETKALSAKAGSLFLWDSRLAHQNLLPGNTDTWRHVVYTCYQPRSLATEKDLALKREAYEDRLVTTHWPAMNVQLFPKEGSSYYADAPGTKKASFKVTDTRKNVEADITRMLAGVMPYPEDSIREKSPLIHMSV